MPGQLLPRQLSQLCAQTLHIFAYYPRMASRHLAPFEQLLNVCTIMVTVPACTRRPQHFHTRSHHPNERCTPILLYIARDRPSADRLPHRPKPTFPPIPKPQPGPTDVSRSPWPHVLTIAAARPATSSAATNESACSGANIVAVPSREVIAKVGAIGRRLVVHNSSDVERDDSFSSWS